MFDISQMFQDSGSSVLAAGVVTVVTVVGETVRRKFLTRSPAGARTVASPSPPNATWPTMDLAFVRAHARILIVDNDDEPVYARLARKGYHVQKIEHLSEVLLDDLEDQFDVVILDVRDVSDDYDAVDGVGVLENIRTRAPWIPIVMFTAWTGNIRAGRRDKVNQLAQRILSKDSSLRELEDTVFDLTSRGMSRDYVVEVLTRLGVLHASDVLTICERAPTCMPEWKLVRADDNTSVQRECVRRVLTVARNILTRQRSSLVGLA